MTPYPLIYTPRGWKSATGAQKPACCPHTGSLPTERRLGPDVVMEGDEVKSGGGGLLWGGDRLDGGTWRCTPAGWWVCLNGHHPQHLLRLGRHPRVIRRAVVEGAQPGQLWSIPVLLEHGPDGYRSAVDGVWDGERWAAGDLTATQETLLAAASGLDTDPDPARHAANIRQLAVDLAAIDQWVDLDLLAVTGWLSERAMLAWILAAAGRSPDLDRDAA